MAVLAPVCAGLALAIGAMLFVALDDPAGVPERVRQRPADVALALAFAAFLVVGGLLAVQRPGHPIAWLLIAEGFVWELGLFCAGYVSHALPAADVADWILDWIWVPGVAGIPLLLLLFPDGRPPSRRWRGVVWLTLAAAVALLALPPVGAVLLPAATLSAFASVLVRYRRAGALERRQLAWFGYAAALIVVSLATAAVLEALGASETVTSYLNVLPLAALPLAIGIALQRHRLYDLETVVDGTVLVVLVAVVYLVTVATLGGWTALAAAVVTGAIAVVARPRASRLVHREPAPLVIQTLGGFKVVRDGEPVTNWPSKKARTLLKILIARRGRPVARDELMELLWPGEDPVKLPNRLSVALSALRGVVGADAIDADNAAVSLDLEHADVDVERLLSDPAQAEAIYAGDFLEEDRYEDWATDLREQAREAYASALRTRARETRDNDEAVRTYLRLLEHDRWDASAHRELIARLDGAGRHGEAIRRRRTYIRAMAEIGVQAAL